MVSNGKLLSAPQLVNPSTIYTTVECVLEGKEKQHSSAPGRKWGGFGKLREGFRVLRLHPGFLALK